MSAYPDFETPPSEYHRMGYSAALQGRASTPPVLIRDDDPRTLAYIDGYETAVHDLRWKGE